MTMVKTDKPATSYSCDFYMYFRKHLIIADK